MTVLTGKKTIVGNAAEGGLMPLTLFFRGFLCYKTSFICVAPPGLDASLLTFY
jgi:hypothetical protein